MIANRLGGPLVAAAAALLLAVNPSFVFWSRQGIFVTNITALFFMASLWFGDSVVGEAAPACTWSWPRSSAVSASTPSCCSSGPRLRWFVVGVASRCSWSAGKRRTAWSTCPARRRSPLAGRGVRAPTDAADPVQRAHQRHPAPRFSATSGRSYYGVDNSAYGSNLMARLGPARFVLLRGDHFWYLGGVNANEYAPWLLLALVLLAAAAGWSRSSRPGTPAPERRFFTPALPLALLVLIVLQSAFTVSDLFITHFALVTPLIPLIAALSFGEILRVGEGALAMDRPLCGRGCSGPGCGLGGLRCLYSRDLSSGLVEGANRTFRCNFFYVKKIKIFIIPDLQIFPAFNSVYVQFS